MSRKCANLIDVSCSVINK